MAPARQKAPDPEGIEKQRWKGCFEATGAQDCQHTAGGLGRTKSDGQWQPAKSRQRA